MSEGTLYAREPFDRLRDWLFAGSAAVVLVPLAACVYIAAMPLAILGLTAVSEESW